METKSQKSIAPLILGICGAIFSLPSFLCTSCVSALLSVSNEKSANAAGGVILVMGIIQLIGGIVGGVLSLSKTKVAGIIFVASSIIALIGLFVTLFSNIFVWIVLILYVIAAIICFVQKV
ncbi:hypothetical protein [Caldicellulosiruptor naganoensis]|uniref:DUF4190 domain-containing protein n=1 Tax=Caldicellulosiruptor naganoensis TaxID=29324 RepID=A0ABY7BGN7_9FIRM|nr:hypothetical protein [Caldicellulosiruptor naganoensis]WAM31984.1 hypothetical protein OTJ99_000472 [Caldicellulosiruptor naganoensis]